MAGIWELLQLLPIGTLILLPGIVWLRCEAKFLVPAKIDQVERAFSYSLYSLLAYSCCFFVFRPEFIEAFTKRELAAPLAIKAGLLLVVTAVIGGTVTGLSRKNDFVGKAFAKIGIQTVHPVETAWVAAFSRKRGCLVRLTFKDGTNRFGVWGTKSLVSCTGSSEDVFLEQTWCEGPDGGLVPEVGTRGIWVRQDEIQCLRFHELEELDNDHAKQVCQQSIGRANFQRGVATDAISGEFGVQAVAGPNSSGGGDKRADACSESEHSGVADCEPGRAVEVKTVSPLHT